MGNEVDGEAINVILADVIQAEPLLSAEMDRKRVKISLLQMELQKSLGFASLRKHPETRKVAAAAYKEYELSMKSAKQLIKKGAILMKEVGQYTKAEPIKEGMLAVMALAQADLQMGKGRTIVEEVLMKKIAQRALPLAQVDANTQISTDLMAKAESSMTTLITTAKAHSFYRGNDDGAPEVEDAEAAFHELVNSGGDQKQALAAMKVAEAIKQAREVKGKNITKAEVQEAMKSSTGNFKNLLRGLGIL